MRQTGEPASDTRKATRTAAFWLERWHCSPLLQDPLSDHAAFIRWLAADDANRDAWIRALGIWRCFDLARGEPMLEAMRHQALALRPRGSVPLPPPGRWTACAASLAIVAGLLSPAHRVEAAFVALQPDIGQHGFLQFDDEPLGKAVQRLDDHAAHPVVIRDARVAALRISGAFPAHDTLGFVETLVLLYPLRFRHLPDGRIEILSRRR